MAYEPTRLDMMRSGLTDMLIGTLGQPLGTYDMRTIVEFVCAYLQAHAWTIREELALAVLQDHPELQKSMAELIDQCQKEQVRHANSLNAQVTMMHSTPVTGAKGTTTNQ